MTDHTMRAVGVLTARVILGLIVGMAGYWKTVVRGSGYEGLRTGVMLTARRP